MVQGGGGALKEAGGGRGIRVAVCPAPSPIDAFGQLKCEGGGLASQTRRAPRVSQALIGEWMGAGRGGEGGGGVVGMGREHHPSFFKHSQQFHPLYLFFFFVPSKLNCFSNWVP